MRFCESEKHKIQQKTAPSGDATVFTSDTDGNISSITKIIDNVDYTTAIEFIEFGKPTRKEYPSGFAIRYEYDNKGYLERITSDDGQLKIWEIPRSRAKDYADDKGPVNIVQV